MPSLSIRDVEAGTHTGGREGTPIELLPEERAPPFRVDDGWMILRNFTESVII